ncbi:MAG: hypothetical protein ACREK6_02320 [Candidatus Rokuibacteriota bacterium]
MTVLLALIWVFCVPGPAPALTFVDMLGTSIALPAPPVRIVSLVPSVTEHRASGGAGGVGARAVRRWSRGEVRGAR